ncbi:MAG: C4-dicarboxylate ABC transporter [Xanthomonadales bacterium]|nr:C4-dicarboxylate ABC transporter [Xanthomonadales bacterium]|tara:strand:- start:822 stop:2093 length:1272 start_codon:yes stop_codon:yes gene_type:complete
MLLILLALLALLGMPLFAVIALGALAAFNDQGLNMTLVVMEFQRIGELPVLVALPLFTFAGVLLSHSRTPERLVDLTRAMFGWMPGGLAILGLGLFALMTAFTGASGITVVALGSLMLPALLKAGYPERFSLGLVTAGSSMGVLFAPSLPLILYAVVAQQVAPGQGIRIEELFLAGILPGLLMLLLMAGWAMRAGIHLPKDETPKPPIGPSLKAALWELPLPFVVLGGIYGGYLLVIEAAVVTAAWVIVTLVAIRRDIAWKKLPGIIAESMVLVGAILVVLGVSMASTNIMIDTQVPQRLFESVEPWISNKYMFLVMINILLLIVGMILDIFAALVIMAPLIIPIALAFGVDPVHLGIIFLANLQIGYCTPPVGINLFLASHRFNKDILVIYRSTLPFLGWLLVALLIITWWPGLSLWLAGRM